MVYKVGLDSPVQAAYFSRVDILLRAECFPCNGLYLDKVEFSSFFGDYVYLPPFAQIIALQDRKTFIYKVF